jgi:hypothetical protein
MLFARRIWFFPVSIINVRLPSNANGYLDTRHLVRLLRRSMTETQLPSCKIALRQQTIAAADASPKRLWLKTIKSR